MSEPLTPRILTQSSMTMLVQVLTEDNSASVTGVDVAPLPADSFGNQRERVRIAWQGDNGTGQRDFVLYGLPEVTWSEQVNPIIPAPAPVLLVESDLPDALTMLMEGFVASGRRRGERPAWLLREDWANIPTTSMELSKRVRDLAKSSPSNMKEIYASLLSSLLPILLEKTAAFHALHWGAEQVLDDVYPWLPRFTRWINREEIRVKGEEAVTALVKMPQTIIHGEWQAEHLRLVEGELWVDGWDRVMVGPAAWDVYCLLKSLRVEEKERWAWLYCGYLAERVAEFTNAEEFVRCVVEMNDNFRCPCCGYFTLTERGVYEICPVCRWQDDDERENYGQVAPERPRGPNHVHLWQARENFLSLGVSEARKKQNVRPPLSDEIP
jgi:hypothetical protein